MIIINKSFYLSVKSAPPFIYFKFDSVSNETSIIPGILPRREQLGDYWTIYHSTQSALKMWFLIALQIVKASAIDTAVQRVAFNMGQTVCHVFNVSGLGGVQTYLEPFSKI